MIRAKVKRTLGFIVWGSLCNTRAADHHTGAMFQPSNIDKNKLRDAIAKTNLKLGDSYVVNPDGVRFGEIGKNLAIRGIMTQVLQGDRFAVWPKQHSVKSPVWPWPAWEARA